MLSVEPIVQAPPIADLFHAVSRRSSCFFLDSSMNIKRLGNYSYLGCDPYLTFQAKGKCVQITRKGKTQTILDHPLEQLRKILAEQPPISASPFPFCGGAVGYFAYDSYPWIEPIAQSHPDELNLPDIFFAFYDGLFVCDHCNDRLYALATGYPSPTKTTLTRLKSILHEASKGSFCKEWPTNLVPSRILLHLVASRDVAPVRGVLRYMQRLSGNQENVDCHPIGMRVDTRDLAVTT